MWLDEDSKQVRQWPIEEIETGAEELAAVARTLTLGEVRAPEVELMAAGPEMAAAGGER